jgi:hypothetical protein
MNCLTAILPRVIVGREYGDTSEMERMFHDVLALRDSGGGGSAGCFSVLRELELNMRLLHVGERHVIKYFQRCALCFGSSMEVMTLILPYRVTVTDKRLSQLFGCFDRLRVIHLHEGTFEGLGPEEPDMGTAEYRHNSDVIESYVHSIASECWALEEIFVRRGGFPAPRRDEWWMVKRSQTPTEPGQRPVCDVSRQAVCTPWDHISIIGHGTPWEGEISTFYRATLAFIQCSCSISRTVVIVSNISTVLFIFRYSLDANQMLRQLQHIDACLSDILRADK